MDQAALLSILGGLYDKLVADVADRVKSQLKTEHLIEEEVEAIIEAWVWVPTDEESA